MVKYKQCFKRRKMKRKSKPNKVNDVLLHVYQRKKYV